MSKCKLYLRVRQRFRKRKTEMEKKQISLIAASKLIFTLGRQINFSNFIIIFISYNLLAWYSQSELLNSFSSIHSLCELRFMYINLLLKIFNHMNIPLIDYLMCSSTIVSFTIQQHMRLCYSQIVIWASTVLGSGF